MVNVGHQSIDSAGGVEKVILGGINFSASNKSLLCESGKSGNEDCGRKEDGGLAVTWALLLIECSVK